MSILPVRTVGMAADGELRRHGVQLRLHDVIAVVAGVAAVYGDAGAGRGATRQLGVERAQAALATHHVVVAAAHGRGETLPTQASERYLC